MIVPQRLRIAFAIVATIITALAWQFVPVPGVGAPTIIGGKGNGYQPIPVTLGTGDSKPAKPLPAGLGEQVSAFIGAYYYLLPNDTKDSIRDRIKPLVTATMLEQLDLSPSTGVASLDDERKSRSLIVAGHALLDQADFTSNSGQTVTVTVPVSMDLVNQDAAHTTNRHVMDFQTTSVWVPTAAGAWTLVEFRL